MSNLPRRPLGFTWHAAAGGAEAIRLEVFVDFCCPFSAKIFHKLVQDIEPAFNKEKRTLDIVFQLTPQPWHPQSSLVHEAFLAVWEHFPQHASEFMTKIFAEENQPLFFDVHVQDLTRVEITERLVQLTGLGDDAKDRLRKLLAVSTENGRKNSGSHMVSQLKYYVKQHRQLGIHVTPTCRVNGVICDTSSGWTTDQWRAVLDPLV